MRGFWRREFPPACCDSGELRMPLPVAHSLAAGAIYAGLDADGGRRGWKRLALAVVIANSPDLDIVVGVLVGDPNRYHQGSSHSLAMVAAVSLLAAAIGAAGYRWPLRGRLKGAPANALMVALLAASHIFLDTLTEDFRAPFGVPLLWPVWSGSVQLWPWFRHVDKLGGAIGPFTFVASLFTLHNLWAVTVEMMTLAPLLAAVLWWRRRQRQGAAAGSKGETPR
ncbi:MAG: metal-dependent hydrolase [Acidobacteriota bacterium]